MQTPPKPNYQRELEQTLSTIPAGTKPHLFLHACCAPCSSYVLEYLSRYFTITIYFYNPNIMPEAEFSHRLAELRRLLQEMPLEGTVSVVAGTWEPERFLALAKGHEHEPERGERCQRCIRLRLEQTMQAANDAHADFVTTTLSISPHKAASFIAQCGALTADDLYPLRDVRIIFQDCLRLVYFHCSVLPKNQKSFLKRGSPKTGSSPLTRSTMAPTP